MANIPQKLIRRPSMAPALINKLAKRNESVIKIGNSKDDDDVENAVVEKKLVRQKTTLNDEELDNEILIRLTAEDPNIDKNESIYDFKERGYRLMDRVSHLAVLYSAPSKIVDQTEPAEKDDNAQEENSEDNQTDAAKEAARQTHEKLNNQFNYRERITQTPTTITKVKSAQTEPPLTSDFSASALQWTIYDFYVEHENNKGKLKESEKHAVEKKDEDVSPAKGGLWRFKTKENVEDLDQLVDSLRIMERITNQNIFDEITQDFKYWDDLSDEYKNGRGSLLPLWKFHFDKVKDLHVTHLHWHPIYDDLFAVSYGSYDFLKQKPGMLSVFSLSNPSHPEYSITMSSGVMCISIHPERPHLIVAGMYDGNVAVFDFLEVDNRPVCQSHPSNGKHYGPVWQVKWQSDDIDGNLNFCSAAADGRISYWTVAKKHLVYCDLLQIWRKDKSLDDQPQPITIMNASVTAIAFHPKWSSLLLVGTDDGHIYLCNKDYTQGILMEYETHDREVKSIQWNYFHPNIFITCSPDHKVKTWDYQLKQPLWIYALDSPVMDTKWAPYSSTVFAAVTKDGKAHVYDLFVNKYQPVCVQMLASKSSAHPTSLTFSYKQPVILVGDVRGFVRALKLSPNLRKSLNKIQLENHMEQEIANLERYITITKDPHDESAEF